MDKQDQLAKLAMLDEGCYPFTRWRIKYGTYTSGGWFNREGVEQEKVKLEALGFVTGEPESYHEYRVEKNYLESYDVMIPLIKRQSQDIIAKMRTFLIDKPYVILHTVPELAEALLRAHGLWNESN